MLRQQRRVARMKQKEKQHSFQPDLSRGRSLYREPYERKASRTISVHDRLYEDGVSCSNVKFAGCKFFLILIDHLPHINSNKKGNALKTLLQTYIVVRVLLEVVVAFSMVE